MKNADKKSIPGGEKRAAPRYRVSLNSSVLITAVRGDDDNKEPYLFLQAQLLDVSRSGLALLISEENMGELALLGDDLVLRLLLPLPEKAIELEAVPARYKQFVESGKGKILLGASITNMNTRDRILFMNFINEYEM